VWKEVASKGNIGNWKGEYVIGMNRLCRGLRNNNRDNRDIMRIMMMEK
jgi:hypothetical protein